ncbi:hypothetical protein AACH10_16630 [Ideonella sp. DXS22W]|uniref:Tyr recombinase domain-containing protein n=1 Tax=Pseudaquabacterium inlustre TaxID=2984192 RepID=A0ABU9CJ61_9BURK
MPRLPGPDAGMAQAMAAALAVGQARRGNRRRLAVFGGVAVLAFAVGQAWNYARPDRFRAGTLLQLSVPDAGRPGAAASAAMVDTLPLITSRPVLQQVARTVAEAGFALPANADDAATLLQQLLQARNEGGGDVVRVEAVGETPALLAAALNALPEALRRELTGRQQQAADGQLAGAKAELARLDTAAGQARVRLETFRREAGVQAERDESEAVSRSRGINTALNTAAEKEAAAEARLRALQDSAAAGRGVTQSRDNPTLAGIESRASQTREELRDMERVYTPEFMAMDPRARALRARLAELERQATQQRGESQEAALQLAREELATAHANVARLKQDLAGSRPALHGASARYAQAKVLEDDLAQVDKARRELLERVTRLEADQRRRVPGVAVLEAAVLPTAPFEPQHGSDTWRVLGGSLLLALLTMALVEVFNRPPPTPAVPAAGHTTVVIPPMWGAQSGQAVHPMLGAAPAPAAPTLAAASMPAATAALAAPARQLLSQPEAAALLAATRGPVRDAAALALMGLTLAELQSLTTADLDAPSATLRVGGAHARALPLPEWLQHALQAGAERFAAMADAPLLADAAGQPLAEADLKVQLACAAVDAGLPVGAALDLGMLRDTCIDWLVGQGLRLSDLSGLVGRIEVSEVAALAARAAERPRVDVQQVARLMPALMLAPPA